jgi:hypothetical protein
MTNTSPAAQAYAEAIAAAENVLDAARAAQREATAALAAAKATFASTVVEAARKYQEAIDG